MKKYKSIVSFMTLLLIILPVIGNSQNKKNVSEPSNQKVILITIDGYRWQELFGGADSMIIRSTKYSRDTTALINQFWHSTKKERRNTLMPFFWNYISEHGVMIGNRYLGGKMQVANGMHFSYPGYNETLCGYPDDEHINSNDKIYNPNVSILELANNSPQYHNKVLAFGSWDVFPYILNEKRSGLEVNAGYRHSLSSHPTAYEKELNDIQDENPRHWEGVRFDTYTFHYALEAMKSRHPKFVYIAFGETDDFAHEGRYDQYLKSAHRTDQFIRQLWEYTEKDPFYKGNTTFIITCDHGRGRAEDNIDNWRGHGQDTPHSEDTWLVAFGKGIPKKGMIINNNVYYNKQIAPTVAKFLNIDFHSKHRDVGCPISF